MSKLREAAQGQPCTLRLHCCNADVTTTVLAHIRRLPFNGTSMKPPDMFGVHACSACHDYLDGRAGWQTVNPDRIVMALGRTAHNLRERGITT